MFKNPFLKNFLRSTLLATLIFALCFAFAACTVTPNDDDGKKDDDSYTHTHEYTVTTVERADLTHCGVSRYTCSCGDTYESTNAAGTVTVRDNSEEYTTNYVITTNTEDVQTGTSAVWEFSERYFFIDGLLTNDLSNCIELCMWIKNCSEKDVTVYLFAFSDDEETSANNFYYKKLTIKSGWNLYTIPFSEMGSVGNPLGFGNIGYFMLDGAYGNTSNDTSTILYLDTLYANNEKTGSLIGFEYKICADSVLFYEDSEAMIYNQFRSKPGFTVTADKNTTYVPVSILAEHRGISNIAYTDTSVSFTYNETEYSFSEGQSVTYTGHSNGSQSGKTLSSKAMVSNGYVMLPMEYCAELFGYNLFYDKMGLAIFSDGVIDYKNGKDTDNITLNSTNSTSIIEIIESLAYDNYTGAEIISLMNAQHPNDEHGRLMVTTEQFEELKKLAKTNETLQNYIARLEKTYGKDGTEFADSVNVFNLTDGRRLLNISRDVMNKVMAWCVLYKLTDDTDYAERIWREIEAVCNFTDPLTGAKSWHPEHLLDTAEIMYPFAIAYDWLYDYWTEERREIMEDAVMEMGYGALLGFGGVADWWAVSSNYTNAVANGYNGYKYSAAYKYNSSIDFSAYHYNAPWTNNWNGVCNGGVVAMCLAFANVNDEFKAYSEYLLSCVYYSVQPGLTAGYAPDGGYAESPGYWEYGTSYLSILFSCLRSACGTDFGLTDAPGFAESFYFVAYICNNNKVAWNYHDSGTGVSTFIYYWFAGISEDKNIANLRYTYLNTTSSISFWDIIFFDEDLIDGEDVELNLDAYYFGISTVTFRSSWDDNYLFCGLHGGYNLENHGNLDIGNYIIEFKGIRFIVDLGSDNYNLTVYNGNAVTYFAQPYRYWFYRERAEGQNTLVINPAKVNTSNKTSGDSAQGKNYDQLLSASSDVLTFESGVNSAYAVIDMGCAYREASIGSIRGMLVTNDRSVVVVQDEVHLTSASTVYSFAHTQSATVKILDDGKSATITRSGVTVLVTLVFSDDFDGDYELTVMDADYLEETGLKTSSEENSRKSFKKLSLKATDCTNFNVAFVYQVLSDTPYEYTWTDIADWTVQ